MPSRPPRLCLKHGCPNNATGSGRCDEHQREADKQRDGRRGTAAERGYGWRWQKASRGFLKKHPLCQCEECDEGRGRVRAATVVDHVIPHRGDMGLFWDRGNWQAMTKECHDRKTARGE